MKGAGKVIVTVGWLGVGVLPRSTLLVAFRCEVYVKIMECLVFDMVGMLVALAVVATVFVTPGVWPALSSRRHLELRRCHTASMWRCSSVMATIVRLKNGRKKTARRYSPRHCRMAFSSPSNRGWMALSCRFASSRARTRQRSGVSRPRGSARPCSLVLAIAAGRSEAVS